MVVRSDHCETCVNTDLEFQKTAGCAKLAENHSALGIRITRRRAPVSLERPLDLQDRWWLMLSCWLPVLSRGQAEAVGMWRCTKPARVFQSVEFDRAEGCDAVSKLLFAIPYSSFRKASCQKLVKDALSCGTWLHIIDMSEERGFICFLSFIFLKMMIMAETCKRAVFPLWIFPALCDVVRTFPLRPWLCRIQKCFLVPVNCYCISK